jgi:hypothetical protein
LHTSSASKATVRDSADGMSQTGLVASPHGQDLPVTGGYIRRINLMRI